MRFTDPHRKLPTRWDGLCQRMESRQYTFERIDLNDYLALGAEDRQAYDDARIDFISGGIVVGIPTIVNAIEAVKIAMDQNSSSGRDDHLGVIISAPGSHGKTTACMVLLGHVYDAYKARFGSIPSGVVPVAFISVPAVATQKSLVMALADFYGLPYPERLSQPQLARMVCEAIHQSHTQLIVLDELQNMAGIGPHKSESLATLKQFSNQVAATFVYSGVDLLGTNMLAGTAGAQLTRRASLVEVTTFEKSSAEGRHYWEAFIRSLGREMPLFATSPDNLAAMSDLLYERTGGNIGSLRNLLSQTAIKVIEGGDSMRECLDADLIHQAVLDAAAEQKLEFGDCAPLPGARGRRRRWKTNAYD